MAKGKAKQCPNLLCRSKDIEPVGVTEVRTLVLGRKKREATFRCKKCGKVFTLEI